MIFWKNLFLNTINLGQNYGRVRNGAGTKVPAGKVW